MAERKTFELDLFYEEARKEELADELERIAQLLREGYREGETQMSASRGWWSATTL